MEMTSPSLRKILSVLPTQDQVTLATVKLGAQHQELETTLDGCLGLEMTKDNREQTYISLVQQLEDFLRVSGS